MLTFCAAAAVSVSTLSGALLVWVTFLPLSHHLWCGWGLCLTFEAPSGRQQEEKKPAHLTFTRAFMETPFPTPPNTHLPLGRVSWLHHTYVLTSWLCCCHSLLRELACIHRPSLGIGLLTKDGEGEQTVLTRRQIDFPEIGQGVLLCAYDHHKYVKLRKQDVPL